MEREYRKWKSPSLGRDMELLIFGTEGTPVILFPTEQGRFFEWEDQGGILALEEKVHMNYNQFYCIDSLAGESFLNRDVDPYTRIIRHSQYMMYIVDELLPFIKKINQNPFIITAGSGLGAYYSLLLALKYPAAFHKAVGVSGYYDISGYLDGFKDDNVYFNNPVEFIPNLNDEKFLNAYAELDLRLLNYDNDPNREATKRMSDTLWLKNITHRYHVWDVDSSNPWSTIPEIVKENLI